MTPPIIGFISGVVVGGFSATLIIGLLILNREPEKGEDIQKVANGLERASLAKSKISKATACETNAVLP